MDEKEFYLVNIGRVLFPSEFNKIFCSRNKYLVSGQVGKDFYFEMNGESMYYMLKGEELAYNYDYSEYKKKIVQAVCQRMADCNGILLHKSLISDKLDTQFRATNSAIRILIHAVLEGDEVKSELESLVNYQYKFFMPFMNGIWFPHDLSEYNKKCRKRQLKTKAFGKERTNTVTLNTHLDSLNTLLLLHSKISNLNIRVEFDLEDLINRAIVPLKGLFYHDLNSSFPSIILQKIDFLFYLLSNKRKKLFFPITKVYDSLLHPLLFKVLFPRLFFNYGFIARDLAIRHRHADYLLPNAVDIARFLCLYESYHESDPLFVADLNKQLYKTVLFINKTESFESDYSIAWSQELIDLIAVLNISSDTRLKRGEKICYNPFCLLFVS